MWFLILLTVRIGEEKEEELEMFTSEVDEEVCKEEDEGEDEAEEVIIKWKKGTNEDNRKKNMSSVSEDVKQRQTKVFF